MNRRPLSLALWILGAALGSFAAGMNIGLAAPGLFGGEEPAGADDDYVRRLVTDYQLSAAQERSLRLVLQRGSEEEKGVYRNVDTATLPESLQKQLLAVRGRVEQRIRAVLDDGQRARYDQDSRPRQTR